MTRTTYLASARCKGCGARIIWAPTVTGKAMPLDAEPNPKGNVLLREGVLLVGASAEDLRDGEALYMPHWATCPERERFKR